MATTIWAGVGPGEVVRSGCLAQDRYLSVMSDVVPLTVGRVWRIVVIANRYQRSGVRRSAPIGTVTLGDVDSCDTWHLGFHSASSRAEVEDRLFCAFLDVGDVPPEVPPELPSYW